MPSKKEHQEVTADEQTLGQVEEAVESLETDIAPEAVAKEVREDSSDAAATAELEDQQKVAKAGKRSAKVIAEVEAEEARQAAKAERAEAEEAPKAPKRQMPNPLHQHGKKYREAAKLVDRTKLYSLDEALELAQKTATTKFDSSVELHVNLGVDPRQADQMVRASVVLPHGTGRTLRVAVFAEGKAAEEAKAAGADIVATDKLLSDIEAGKLSFDILIATPDKMATLGKVAKVLGPRGLMPNPKSGTVTPDAAKAVTEAKAGKVEFRIDKQAIIHIAFGKASFKADALRENAAALLDAVLKAKPSAVKGTYVKAIAVTSSMGPGIKVDAAATVAGLSAKK